MALDCREIQNVLRNVFNLLLSLQLMGLLGPKLFNTSYQFISNPVSTILGHLKRGCLEKGEQVCV